uniref:Ig-like domain-containing protein n=1 Tax=Gopherus evgoodei TaxID=1825980 RepID=A0A8C4Y7S8_9SAUR
MLTHCCANFLSSICIYCFSGLSTEKNNVTQRQGQLIGVQNDSVTLGCTFSTEDAGYDIYWYKQGSSGQTKYVFRRSVGSEHKGAGSRFSLDFRRAKKYVGLKIAELELSDSAMYFCAIAERALGYHGGWVNRGDYRKSSDQFFLDSETKLGQIEISVKRHNKPQAGV